MARVILHEHFSHVPGILVGHQPGGRVWELTAAVGEWPLVAFSADEATTTRFKDFVIFDCLVTLGESLPSGVLIRASCGGHVLDRGGQPVLRVGGDDVPVYVAVDDAEETLITTVDSTRHVLERANYKRSEIVPLFVSTVKEELVRVRAMAEDGIRQAEKDLKRWQELIKIIPIDLSVLPFSS